MINYINKSLVGLYLSNKGKSTLQYNEKEPLIAIGTVAKMLKIHQRTLRIYDEIGILRPKRSGKNRRLYSIEDCRLAQIITFLTRNLGINLAGV